MKFFEKFKKKKLEEKEKVAKEKKPALPKKEKKGDLGRASQVLIQPITSEKATSLGQYNQYVFEVAPKSNKMEVKKALQAIYGVLPLKVNIINVQGKKVRYSRIEGRTKNWSKAVVKLRAGEKIEVQEK